ncbi:MAG TPA: hypothetical protein VNQ74_04815 [Burkholderiaceae bacterium]|nr:hypothetical protein [Burkholderiaceae bacterium]
MQGCGLSTILLVSRAKGHLAAIAVDREVIAIQIMGDRMKAVPANPTRERHDPAYGDLGFAGIDKNAPQRGLYDERWRGSLRRKRRDRRMMRTSSSGII